MAGPGAVKSAIEAEVSARSFLASRFPYAIEHVHKVAYQRADHLWKVHGSYRLPHWTYLKRFLVEIDADSGNVMGFEL